MNEWTCDECKHKDVSVNSYPCKACHYGSHYEPKEVTAELKPCPFCGGQPEIVTPEETDGQYWFIACTNDNCWGIAVSDFCETESEAIDKWNRRDGKNHDD